MSLWLLALEESAVWRATMADVTDSELTAIPKGEGPRVAQEKSGEIVRGL